ALEVHHRVPRIDQRDRSVREEAQALAVVLVVADLARSAMVREALPAALEGVAVEIDEVQRSGVLLEPRGVAPGPGRDLERGREVRAPDQRPDRVLPLRLHRGLRLLEPVLP